MSEITIYGLPHMSYVRTPIMICEEKGVEYEVVKVKSKSPELAGLHPFGRMPILKHDTQNGAFMLYEANAIALYLNDVFPDPGFVPKTAQARAHMIKWMNNVDSYYYPLLMRDIVFPRLINPKRQIPVDEAQFAVSLKALPHYLDIVERDLGAHKFLADDHISLADFALFPLFTWLEKTREGRSALDGRSALNNWIAAMTQMPSHSASEAGLPD